MPRLPDLTERDALPPEALTAFDEIAASRGAVYAVFAQLMHSPEHARRVAHLGALVRFESSLPDADRELASLAASAEVECELEREAHVRFARDAGVSEQAIAAARDRESAGALGEGEALLVRFARSLASEHRVPEPIFAAARERYGDRGLVELVTTVGYYCLLACVANAFEVEPLDGPPPRR